jgi:hypothetical protein
MSVTGMKLCLGSFFVALFPPPSHLKPGEK